MLKENGMWIYQFSDRLESINLERLNIDLWSIKMDLFQIFKKISFRKEFAAELKKANKSIKKKRKDNKKLYKLSKEQYRDFCLINGVKPSEYLPLEIPIMRKNEHMEEI